MAETNDKYFTYTGTANLTFTCKMVTIINPKTDAAKSWKKHITVKMNKSQRSRDCSTFK